MQNFKKLLLSIIKKRETPQKGTPDSKLNQFLNKFGKSLGCNYRLVSLAPHIPNRIN